MGHPEGALRADKGELLASVEDDLVELELSIRRAQAYLLHLVCGDENENRAARQRISRRVRYQLGRLDNSLPIVQA